MRCVLVWLMHRLPSTAGLSLSLRPHLVPMQVVQVVIAAALSAFFSLPGSAQTHAPSKPSAKATNADIASIQRGLAIYSAKCTACHSAEENHVGPAHAGVFGRRAGKAKDYAYSPALLKSKVVWNKASLDAWLTEPEKLIPGQRMGYRLSLASERADVVAYLASLSASK
jgi:cytochrome c